MHISTAATYLDHHLFEIIAITNPNLSCHSSQVECLVFFIFLFFNYCMLVSLFFQLKQSHCWAILHLCFYMLNDPLLIISSSFL